MKDIFRLRCLATSLVVFLLAPRLLMAESPPHDVLSPSAISSKYLGGATNDVQMARTLLRAWLEAKRQSEEYEDNHDSNYACAVGIVKAADGGKAVDAFLEQELSKTKSRRSRYAILRQMAERKEMEGAYDEAIGLWKRCRESVMDGTHPYYTTRQALPLIKIGQLFLASGRREAAKDYLEQYVSSEYGSKVANDVFVLLGNLYEESGAWDKAKALYDHYSQFSYYSDDTELKRRLSLPEHGVLIKAQELLDRLRADEPAKRRAARNALYGVILSSGTTDPWVRWLTKIRSAETNGSLRDEFEILLPLLTPLAEIGNRSIRGDVDERLKRMEEDRKQNRAYEELLETLFSRKIGNTYMNVRQLGFGGPYTLAGLSSTSEFRDVTEKLYAQTRTRLLNPSKEPPDNERVIDSDAKAASDGLLGVLRENQTFRDCLKKCVSLQDPKSGHACLLLYALGFKEDITFIIDHIPEDAYKRNQMMLWLAAGLYRERTVDIPKVMGCDKAHVRDWWNVDPAGKNVPQAFRDWWSTKKERFEYSTVEAAGHRVFGADFTSRMTSIALAPEIDGVFFFVEGGFLDYSGSVYFFSFRTGECRPIIDENRDGGQGVYASANAKWRQSGNRIDSLSDLCWNPQTMGCEFKIASDKRIGILFNKDGSLVEAIQDIPASVKPHPIVEILGPGIQRHGDLTVEIRRGDLFLVNETSGREACIESFGYVLSFTLNRQGTKLLTVDREILGQSLNLYDIEEKVALLQTH